MAKLISKTYGEALFELAKEEDKTEVLLQEVTEIKKIFVENPEYVKLLTHPRISAEEKKQSVKEVFEGKIDGEILGFMELIISKSRTDHILEIFDYFIDLVKAYKGIGVCYVTTPMELSVVKKESISNKMLSITNFNEMEMHYNVDASLLGGMQIRIGDKVVDSSIQTKLNRLQKDLLKLQV